MTVVNPKSISGINSITMASGSDDLLTIHSNNTTERVRVNNSGDVIVGSGVTLSPDGDAFFTGVCTATSFVGSGANLTGISGVSVANQSDNRLITATGTTDALNGESGLTYDGSTLQVSGNVDLSDSNKLMIGDSDDLQIDHSGTNSQIYHNGTGSLYIAALGSGEDVNLQSTSGKMTFTTGGSERLRITDDGIKFNGDNAATNALDDYEEGTFTPTMANSVTLHSGNDLLSYVKVGHLVHVTGVVRINSGNSSSDIAITNMPFATVNASDQAGNAIGSVSIYDNNMNSGYSQVICVMNPNSTQLNVVLQTQSGSQQLGMDAADNGYIGVSICYRAA